MKLLSAALLALSAPLLAATPALADTATFSLANPIPTTTPGVTLTFNGTIAAPITNAGPIYLLGDNLYFEGPHDDSDFDLDTPAFLSPGSSYVGPLFTVTVPNYTGLYNGTFTLNLADSNNNAITDTANFVVTAATPEPGSWLLLSTGLAGAAALRRRYTRA